ncbi:MAG: hypothetical protein VXU42_07120, partial [Verrucomicrobiota bacterium]|nr:hypothetical protein [Verrucomicrobiota bacterium]
MMDRISWEKEASRMVKNYIDMRSRAGGGSMYREAMWQYADMAHGGDGGPTGKSDNSTIRGDFYPNHPNEFFFMVLSGLGEFELYMK